MIINNKYKYIFVGIPYSASSAISVELIKNYEGELILNKHSNIPHLLKTTKINLKEYTVFGVYKDPIQIKTTVYNKLKHNPQNRYTNPEYLRKNGGYVTQKAANLSKLIRGKNISFQEYIKVTSTKFGLILPFSNVFTINAPYFDFVIDFNDLDNDFKKIMQKIGFENTPEFAVINKTTKSEDNYTIEKSFEKKYIGPFYYYNRKYIPRPNNSIEYSRFHYIIFCTLQILRKMESIKRDLSPRRNMDKYLKV